MQYFVNEKVNLEVITEKHIFQVFRLDLDFSTDTTIILKCKTMLLLNGKLENIWSGRWVSRYSPKKQHETKLNFSILLYNKYKNNNRL